MLGPQGGGDLEAVPRLSKLARGATQLGLVDERPDLQLILRAFGTSRVLIDCRSCVTPCIVRVVEVVVGLAELDEALPVVFRFDDAALVLLS